MRAYNEYIIFQETLNQFLFPLTRAAKNNNGKKIINVESKKVTFPISDSGR